MIKKRIILTLIFSLFVALGCSNDSEQVVQKLIITGSSTVAPLVLELAKRYESQNPSVRIDVQTGGSSRGISDARKGLADLGMVSRALKKEETDLKGFTIALDGLSIITHKDNPISELSNRQIVDIFTGKLTNWSDVGGDDMPITVVSKAEGRSTLEVFLKYYKLKSPDIKASVIIGDNEQGIKTVVGNRNSIGYVSIGAAENSVANGSPIKLLPTAGIPATLENVLGGIFPISRELNLISVNEPEGLAKEFLMFAQSAEVHDLVSQLYFVPVKK